MRQSFDHEKISLNVARLKKQGHIFEIVIDPDKAVEFKEGKKVTLPEVLKAEKVYADARKGLLASEHLMQEFFESTDPMVVAQKVLAEGEIQFTVEHRAKVREEKLKRIIALISRNGVDPKTHLPHPPQRIANALEEAKVHVQEFKSVEEQIPDIVKKIRVVLPIRFEIKELALKIPPEYAPKAYGPIKQFGTLLKEEWESDGSFVCTVEIPGGMESEFFDKLNSITHGTVESKLLQTR